MVWHLCMCICHSPTKQCSKFASFAQRWNTICFSIALSLFLSAARIYLFPFLTCEVSATMQSSNISIAIHLELITCTKKYLNKENCNFIFIFLLEQWIGIWHTSNGTIQIKCLNRRQPVQCSLFSVHWRQCKIFHVENMVVLWMNSVLRDIVVDSTKTVSCIYS